MNKEATKALQNLVSYFYNLLRQERTEFFRRYSLTRREYDVLLCLGSESMNLVSLSERLALDSSTLVGIVDRLEKKELIKKKVNPMDRRKNIITVTDEGRKNIETIPEFISPVLQKVLDSLEVKEQSVLIKILKKIVEKTELTDLVPFIPEEDRKLVSAASAMGNGNPLDSKIL